MRFLQKFALMTHVICTLSYTCQENTIIRLATINDLDAIAELTRQTYYEHYKPLLQQMPAITSLNTELDHFIEEKLQQAKKATQEFIIKQQNNEPYRVLVVYNKNTNALMGSCRFNKKDHETLYIYSFFINKNFQRMGLGTQLLSAAHNMFEDVTQCKLRAFINNTQAHNFYEKHGFQKVGIVALNIVTGAVVSDPTIPPTHIDYQLILRR